jgi:beta-glucosidase
MRKQLGDRLPTFTPEEIAVLKGSNDFYGMNHYTANFIRHKKTEPEEDDFLGNLETLFESKSGEIIGPETQSVWLRPNPQGFHDLILWISKRYGFPPSTYSFLSFYFPFLSISLPIFPHPTN